MATLRVVSCRHPTEHAERLLAARDYVTGRPFEVVRCNACGVARTEPQPDPQTLVEHYPASYYGQAASRRFPKPVEVVQAWLWARRARLVQKLSGAAHGRVLDVGCGRGGLLRAFLALGWRAEGTELDERAAAVVRDDLGVVVHVVPADALPVETAALDAVTMWHVLEHLGDPVAALREVRRVLRPGGVLLVAAPDFASPESRASGAGWFHLDVPRHLFHLDHAWLERTLGESGFEVWRRSFLAPEYDTFSFAQSSLNALGLRQNLFYDLLRAHGARLLEPAPADRWQAPVSWVAGSLLAATAMPITVLAGWLDRGATMTFWAVRRAD